MHRTFLLLTQFVIIHLWGGKFLLKYYFFVVGLITSLTVSLLTSPTSMRYHRCFREVIFSDGKIKLMVFRRVILVHQIPQEDHHRLNWPKSLFHRLHGAPIWCITCVGLVGDGYEIWPTWLSVFDCGIVPKYFPIILVCILVFFKLNNIPIQNTLSLCSSMRVDFLWNIDIKASKRSWLAVVLMRQKWY